MRRARSLARKVHAHDSTLQKAKLDANVVWFCVPDSRIEKIAGELSSSHWNDKCAFHSSGVLPAEVLSTVRKKGAAIASVHPLMTFIHGSLPDLRGVAFAIEGDRPAVKIAATVVRNLKATPRRIRAQDKPAYHAFATMICPLLVALLASAEQAARAAGVSAREARRRMRPIIIQTAANYVRFGAAKAFTGAIVRGDTQTVRLHLQALAKSPAAQKVYAALLEAALELLPSQKKNELKKFFAGISLRPSR